MTRTVTGAGSGTARLIKLVRHSFPDIVLAVLATLLAFVIRALLLRQYDLPLMIHEQDAVGYMRVAHSLLDFSGAGLETRPPGYPVVIALCSFFTGNFEVAARVAAIIMDALVCLPLYALARTVLSRGAAACAAACWACFSYALFFSLSPLSQSTWLFFLLSGTWLLISTLHRDNARLQFICLSSACFACSYLTRPEGLPGFGFGLVFFGAAALATKQPLRQILILLTAYILTFAACTAPYFLYLKLHLGNWDVSSKTSAALKGQDGMMILNKDGTLPTAGSGLAPWLEHYRTFPEFLNSSKNNFMQFFKQYLTVFPVWFHGAVLAGFVFLALGTPWETLFLTILLLVTLPNYIVNISKTLSYLYSVFPLAFICMAAAVERPVAKVIGMTNRTTGPMLRSAALTILIPLTAWFCWTSYGMARSSLDDPGLRNEVALTRRVFIDASSFIRSQSRGNELIMTRWGLISYYSGLPTISLPKGSIDDVLAYGRKNGAIWLLIDSPSVFSRRQELQPLLTPDVMTDTLQRHRVVPVHVGGMDGLGIYVVYRYL